MLRLRLLDTCCAYRSIQSHMMLPAPSSGESAAKGADIEVLLVRLSNELYALRAASVREVMRFRPWTPVPGAPASLPGIISQRGMILPIVELRPLLGLDRADLTRAARLVIVVHDDIGMVMLVEEVLDLVAIPADTIEAAPAAPETARARFVRGIARYERQPVSLLDLDILIMGLRETG